MTTGRRDRILIVDDEAGSDIMNSVRRKLDGEGFETVVVQPQSKFAAGHDFESEALIAIETVRPSAVLLDVRFGDHPDDQFKGLGILRKIVEKSADLPVLMFTQYSRGPHRDAAVAGSLRFSSSVDFIDKLASPDEVVLRLRRLIGKTPVLIQIGEQFLIDGEAGIAYAVEGDRRDPIRSIQGMKFSILLELASAWYRSPGELVPFWKLERFSEGEDSRASLRVRVREIKDALGEASGRKFGPDDLIVNVRNRGYVLVVPR
ncbi:MAG: response regulator transcription factor [SAR202 cluster bacterium]|nr:response regulator transcription factor [SAR202 cluster bacterium]